MRAKNVADGLLPRLERYWCVQVQRCRPEAFAAEGVPPGDRPDRTSRKASDVQRTPEEETVNDGGSVAASTTWHNVAQRGTTWHNVAQHGTTWHIQPLN
jgi:hypothetical protein